MASSHAESPSKRGKARRQDESNGAAAPARSVLMKKMHHQAMRTLRDLRMKKRRGTNSAESRVLWGMLETYGALVLTSTILSTPSPAASVNLRSRTVLSF